jgi:hypothetical protein
MKTLLLTFALSALTLFAPDQEQTPPDSPHHAFQDDLLDKMTGQWKLTGTIRGQTVEYKVEAQWTLNHQFLQVHEKDARRQTASGKNWQLATDHCF